MKQGILIFARQNQELVDARHQLMSDLI